MNYLKKVLRKPLFLYFTANAIYSLSTFVVTLCIPFIFEKDFFATFIYDFQMVLFLTTVTNLGIVSGLYKFIVRNRNDSLNIYYTILTVVYLLIFALGCVNGNIVSRLINLGEMTNEENFMFYISLLVSSMFVYNKGKNVADRNYRYLFQVTLTACLLRLFALIFLFLYPVHSLSLALFVLFVLPFVQDIKDHICNSSRYIHISAIKKEALLGFLSFSLRVWFIGTLFMVSDKMFLIGTKGIDKQFTTGLAFAGGFLGIISLFNQTFQNYFVSKLSCNNPAEVYAYLQRIKKLALPFFLLLLLICATVSFCADLIYSSLGEQIPILLFLTLLRAGLLSYLVLYSLLTKVLDLLNIEIMLNVLRFIVTYALCNFWQADNMLLWYTTVLFVIPFPEVVLAFLTNQKARRNYLTESQKKHDC